MNSIYLVLKQIKNLIPYFALISLYFFFVNIEAKKDDVFQGNIEKEENSPKQKSKLEDKQLRVTIPVIPYEQ